MSADDLLDLLAALDGLGTAYWLDGGWGVDCLLGEQTRPHGDVDLALPRADLPVVRELLTGRGYVVTRDWLPTSIAFRDAVGREVDLHPVDPTDDGGGDQVLEDGTRWHYAPPVDGVVAGRAVRCAPAADQLRMHQGYELRPTDVEDVRRLVARFGPVEP